MRLSIGSRIRVTQGPHEGRSATIYAFYDLVPDFASDGLQTLIQAVLDRTPDSEELTDDLFVRLTPQEVAPLS